MFKSHLEDTFRVRRQCQADQIKFQANKAYGNTPRSGMFKLTAWDWLQQKGYF